MLETTKDSNSETNYPYYSKAPITEAVIDIRIKESDSITFEKLSELGDLIKNDYPTSETLWGVQHILSFGGDDPKIETASETTRSAFKYQDISEKRIVISSPTGLLFSQLAPYERWEPFSTEAKRIWNLYQSVVSPTAVTRLAVRFINRIDLPPGEDFSKFLRTYPEVSIDMSQELSTFFMQLELPQRDIDSKAVIIQTIVPSPRPNYVSIILDIDLFRDYDFGTDEAAIWEFFQKLRLRKDEIFEACITDLVREEIR